MMNRSFRATFFAAMVIVGGAAAQGAHDPVAAEALFRDGRDAFKKGDYATACPKFAESQRLDPATGTLFNLADCEEHAGRLASAWMHWRDVVDALRTNPSDERYAVAAQRVGVLEPRLPRLRVHWAGTAASGAVVKRDGVELGAASLETALPTDPGSHSVEVTAPGHKPMSYTTVAEEGKVTDLEITTGDRLAEHAAAPSTAGGTLAYVPERASSSSPLPAIGWVTVGLGGVLLAIGVGTGAGALADKSTVDQECNTAKLCTPKGAGAASDGHTLATVSTATFIIGSSLVVGGIVLVLAGSGRSSKVAQIPLWLQGRF